MAGVYEFIIGVLLFSLLNLAIFRITFKSTEPEKISILFSKIIFVIINFVLLLFVMITRLL
jgi:hypothetical protein